MPSGLFTGLEDEVESSAASIGAVLRKYPSSTAGKQLKAEFSATYYKFLEHLWKGLDQLGDDNAALLKAHMVSRLSLDLNMLSVALTRAFRRALYCNCFNGIELAQMKQAGLFAYWLSEMHPIIVGAKPEGLPSLSNDLERGLQEINERFAFYIVSVFYRVEFGRDIALVDGYQQHFVHAVKYRSFTEDSLMLVTESLGASSRKGL